MQTVTLDEAQSKLAELVHQLGVGGEVVILEEKRPVARLLPAVERPSLRDLEPVSVGAVLRPFPLPEDDLLEEMTHPPNDRR
jgi:antitoxin (DNA-binding transcriptional repressor) of toxin-antitoxin stability system